MKVSTHAGRTCGQSVSMTTRAFHLKKFSRKPINKAVRLEKKLGVKGFEDIPQDEVKKVIDDHSEPLIDEDLLELTKSASEEEREATDPEQEEEE